MKKAQGGDSFWIIIGVVLALLVLGTLAYIFISRGVNPFSRGIKACSDKGGVCINLEGKTCAEVDPSYPIYGFKGCFVNERLEKDFTCCFGTK